MHHTANETKNKICFVTAAALRAANSSTLSFVSSPVYLLPYLGCSLQTDNTVRPQCLKQRAATDAVGHPSPSRHASVRTRCTSLGKALKKGWMTLGPEDFTGATCKSINIKFQGSGEHPLPNLAFHALQDQPSYKQHLEHRSFTETLRTKIL